MAEAWFGHARTLQEQLQGLEPALAAAPGRTVLDLGCAEGWIAREFQKAGAVAVHGVECNAELKIDPAVRVWRWNLNDGLPPGLLWKYDIVLLLAIVHKLRNPEERLKQYAALATERVVIRLPIGSTGMIRSKNFPDETCNCAEVMQGVGFVLEQTLPGPRGELVQHWVKP
jgi:hypothetical protein